MIHALSGNHLLSAFLSFSGSQQFVCIYLNLKHICTQQGLSKSDGVIFRFYEGTACISNSQISMNVVKSIFPGEGTGGH